MCRVPVHYFRVVQPLEPPRTFSKGGFANCLREGTGTVTRVKTSYSPARARARATYIADNFHQNDEQFSLSGNG